MLLPEALEWLVEARIAFYQEELRKSHAVVSHSNVE
jgi:hypothetical protein